MAVEGTSKKKLDMLLLRQSHRTDEWVSKGFWTYI